MEKLNILITLLAMIINIGLHAQSLKEFTIGEKVENFTAKEKLVGRREILTTVGKIKGILTVNILNDGRVAMAVFTPNENGDDQIDRLFNYELDLLINGISKKNNVELIPITREGGVRPHLYMSKDGGIMIKAAYDDFGEGELVPKYRIVVIIGNYDLP